MIPILDAFTDTIKSTSWENVLPSNGTTGAYIMNSLMHFQQYIYLAMKKKVKLKIDKNKSPSMTKCISKSIIKKIRYM